MGELAEAIGGEQGALGHRLHLGVGAGVQTDHDPALAGSIGAQRSAHT